MSKYIHEGRQYYSWVFLPSEMDMTKEELEEKYEKKAKFISGLNVYGVMAFGLHFRWDYVEYFDKIREIYEISVAACHRYGIKFGEHHSVVYSHQARNAEDLKYMKKNLSHHGLKFRKKNVYHGSNIFSWVQKSNINGWKYEEPYKAIMFCTNNPDFREKYLQMLKETTLYTGIDILMPDDVAFTKEGCFCEYCKQKFKDKTGVLLDYKTDEENDPFWGNHANPLWKQWLQFKQESVEDFHKWLKAALGKEKISDLRLMTCCSNAHSTWVYNSGLDYFRIGQVYNTVCHEILRTTYIPYSWKETATAAKFYQGIGGRTSIPVVSIAYALDVETYIFSRVMLNGIANDVWIDLRNKKREDIDFDSQTSLKYVSAAKKITQMDNFITAETPDRGDKPFEISSAADVVLVYSRATRDFFQNEEMLKEFFESGRSYSTYDNYSYGETFGWGEFFLEQNINFDFLFEEDISPEHFADYKLAILPNTACFDKDKLPVLDSYLSNGGKIIATGESGCYDMEGNKLARPAFANLAANSNFTKIDDLLGRELFLPYMIFNENNENIMKIIDERDKSQKDRARNLLESVLPKRSISLECNAGELLMNSYFVGGATVISLLNTSNTSFKNATEVKINFDNDNLPGLFTALDSKDVSVRLRNMEISSAVFKSFEMDNPIKLEVTKDKDALVINLNPEDLQIYGVLIVR